MKRDDAFNLLKDQDWENIAKRLTHYAIWRMSLYLRPSDSIERFPEGKTPEDMACGAIEKVWSGERNWDPAKYPDLFTHLTWIVKSDVGHLFSSEEHKLDAGLLRAEDDPDIENGSGGTVRESRLIIEVSVKTRTPEEQLIAREKEECEEKLKAKLYDMVKGDEDLELLLVFFEDGIDKPETIAAEMGWEVTKVYNLKRKFLRKASRLHSASKVQD